MTTNAFLHLKLCQNAKDADNIQGIDAWYSRSCKRVHKYVAMHIHELS